MLLFWESLQGCQLESKAALVVACCWGGGRICSWSLQQGPPKMKDCAIFEIHFNISNPTPSRANFVVAFKANGTKLQIKARNFWKHSANQFKNPFPLICSQLSLQFGRSRQSSNLKEQGMPNFSSNTPKIFNYFTFDLNVRSFRCSLFGQVVFLLIMHYMTSTIILENLYSLWQPSLC